VTVRAGATGPMSLPRRSAVSNEGRPAPSSGRGGDVVRPALVCAGAQAGPDQTDRQENGAERCQVTCLGRAHASAQMTAITMRIVAPLLPGTAQVPNAVFALSWPAVSDARWRAER
jgi:hypothetical protein